MPDWITTSLLVVARISALVLIVPGLRNSWLTWRMRGALVIVLALPVLCVVSPVTQSTHQVDLFVQIAREWSIGTSLALVPAVLVLGLTFATESIQGMTGLPSAGNSNTDISSATTQFFYLTCIAVFFGCSGHRHIIQALLNSFRWLPPGSAMPLMLTKGLLLDVFTQSFQLGVRSLAPIGMALAVSLLALSAVNRVMPHLNYFAVGMSVQSIILFAAIIIFLGGLGLYLESSIEQETRNWERTAASIGTPDLPPTNLNPTNLNPPNSGKEAKKVHAADQ